MSGASDKWILWVETQQRENFTTHVHNFLVSDRYQTTIGRWNIQRIKIAKPTEFIYNTRPDWWS